MTVGYRILNERASADALVARLPAPIQTEYRAMGHLKTVPVFIDRVLYLYECAGRDSKDKQRPPKVLAMLRVINMSFTLDQGFQVTLLNETTNEKQIITTTPAKVFGYPVFAQVPTSFALRYNQLVWTNGRTRFDASAVIYVLTKNKSAFFSMRNIYLETPQEMQVLYPEFEWRPDRV